MDLARLWSFIADKNIEPNEILDLVEEVKTIDTSSEENLRQIIKKVSIIAKKDFSEEDTKKLISKIQTDGIDASILNYF